MLVSLTITITWEKKFCLIVVTLWEYDVMSKEDGVSVGTASALMINFAEIELNVIIYLIYFML